MKQSIRLGRIAGIPTAMRWTVVVIGALITDMLAASVLSWVIPHQAARLYWAVAAGGAVLFVAALAAHEIAQAIVAKHCGIQVRSITLWTLGGITRMAGDPPMLRADLQIAIGGPATRLAAGSCWRRRGSGSHRVRPDGARRDPVALLSLTDIVQAVFNLLPGGPLDGGRVLRGLVWKRYGDWHRASRAAARSGQVLGTGLACSACGSCWAGGTGATVARAARRDAPHLSRSQAGASQAGRRPGEPSSTPRARGGQKHTNRPTATCSQAGTRWLRRRSSSETRARDPDVPERPLPGLFGLPACSLAHSRTREPASCLVPTL